MRVDHGRLHVGVNEVLLDLPDVHAVEEQVGRAAISLAVPRIWWSNAATSGTLKTTGR